VQIRKGDYDGALRDLANVVPSEFGKYEYLVHYTIGHAAGLRGAKRTRGKPAKTVGELYELYRSNKDHQSAKKSLRKSIELNPEFSPAHYWLAVYLSCEGRFAEAFLAADSLVKRVPRCATAYKLRGGLHRDLDRNVEAYADFQTAADLGPNDPETYSDMAGVCSNLGEDAKEIDAYEAAIRLKSPTANVWYYNMGRAYQRMGKYEQALACYKKAKSLGFWPPGGDEEVAKCRERLK
jgi:tetratricopeptide (TPR) repeat protein